MGGNLMALNDSKFEGGGSLSNPSRPNTSDPRVENQNFFPTEAWEFDDPNGIKNNKADVKLKLKPGWKLDANSIILENTNESLNDILDGSGRRIETNRNELSTTNGNLSIVSETVFPNGISSESSIELVSNKVTDLEENVVEIGDDSKLTSTEKQYLREEWNRIQEEFIKIHDALDPLDGGGSPEFNDYKLVYDALDLYLNTTLDIFDDMTTTTDIDRATWNAKWNAYYSQDMARNTVVEAEVNLKAEVRDSTSGAVAGAYIRMSAGLSDNDEIELDSDSIRLGAQGEPSLNSAIEIEANVIKIRGDLEILADDYSRFISAGSTGIYAEDSSGAVIHDLPNDDITDVVYGGHLMTSVSSGSFSHTHNVDTGATTATSPVNLSGQINTTVGGIGGNTNLRAIGLRVAPFLTVSTGKYHSHPEWSSVRLTVTFFKSPTSKVQTGQCVFDSTIMPTIGGSVGRWGYTTDHVVVPVLQDSGNDVISYEVLLQGFTLTSSSGNVYGTVKLEAENYYF